MAKPRTGAPVTPDVATAGATGSTARVLTFREYARPCLVTNTSGSVAVNVKVNEANASATSWHVQVPANATVDVSYGGQIDVKSLSLYMASGAYSTALVHGWNPR